MGDQNIPKTVDLHLHGFMSNSQYFAFEIHQCAIGYADTLAYFEVHAPRFHVLIFIEETFYRCDLPFTNNRGFAVPVYEIDSAGGHANIAAVCIADFYEYIGFKKRLFNDLDTVAPFPPDFIEGAIAFQSFFPEKLVNFLFPPWPGIYGQPLPAQC